MMAPQIPESPVRVVDELNDFGQASPDDQLLGDEREALGYDRDEEAIDVDADEDEEGDNDNSDDDQIMEETAGASEGALTVEPRTAVARGKRKKQGAKLSKHGIEYPSLPQGVVKRLAQTFAKSSGVKGKVNADTINAIMQASDWFFEQLGSDLQAYANHAGRKTINESDMLTLMRRYVTF
jgi:histone H3/H4